MLWIEVWIGKGLSDFLQHTIFKFYVLGHKVKLFKPFQSSPIFLCLLAEFIVYGYPKAFPSGKGSTAKP